MPRIPQYGLGSQATQYQRGHSVGNEKQMRKNEPTLPYIYHATYWISSLSSCLGGVGIIFVIHEAYSNPV